MLCEIAKLESTYLTPDVVASVIECEPHRIRLQAATSEGREMLGFPVVRIGKVTKVPCIPFLRYMGWEGAIKGADDE